MHILVFLPEIETGLAAEAGGVVEFNQQAVQRSGFGADQDAGGVVEPAFGLVEGADPDAHSATAAVGGPTEIALFGVH